MTTHTKFDACFEDAMFTNLPWLSRPVSRKPNGQKHVGPWCDLTVQVRSIRPEALATPFFMLPVSGFGTSPVILMSCFEQNASIALFALASERKPCTFPCASVMECLPFRIGETEGAHPHLNRMPADEPDD